MGACKFKILSLVSLKFTEYSASGKHAAQYMMR